MGFVEYFKYIWASIILIYVDFFIFLKEIYNKFIDFLWAKDAHEGTPEDFFFVYFIKFYSIQLN